MQLPGFIDQYAKRVDAHHKEAQRNFSGFQDTADRHFAGDVEAMIQHYLDGGDVVFREGGENIRKIWQRVQLLAAELAAVQRPYLQRSFHVLFAADEELLAETTVNYDFVVPLNQEAVLTGVGIGFLAALLVEWLVMGLARLFRGRAGSVRRY